MNKILVIAGDIWHTMEVIKTGFSYVTEFYDQMTFVEDAKDMLVPADLEQFDLVICCKGNNLTSGHGTWWFENGVSELNPKDFEAYVKNGGSFLSVHAGNSFSEKDVPEPHYTPCVDYIHFVGNRFVYHPPRCPVTCEVIKDHPVTAEVKTFCERDEHYQVEITAQDADILMESTSATGQRMPAAYVREMEKGRLCVLMPGHILSVWKNPEYQKLLTNAIRWCLKTENA